MVRPIGSKSRPGAQKSGPKPKSAKIVEILTTEEILQVKQAILELIEAEEADNITEACEILGFPKLKAFYYSFDDKEWANQIRQAQQIKADRLEADLDAMNNPVARIFRLKKLRHEYRDTYKFDLTNESLEKLLRELKELAKPKQDDNSTTTKSDISEA